LFFATEITENIETPAECLHPNLVSKQASAKTSSSDNWPSIDGLIILCGWLVFKLTEFRRGFTQIYLLAKNAHSAFFRSLLSKNLFEQIHKRLVTSSSTGPFGNSNFGPT